MSSASDFIYISDADEPMERPRLVRQYGDIYDAAPINAADAADAAHMADAADAAHMADAADIASNYFFWRSNSPELPAEDPLIEDSWDVAGDSDIVGWDNTDEVPDSKDEEPHHDSLICVEPTTIMSAVYIAGAFRGYHNAECFTRIYASTYNYGQECLDLIEGIQCTGGEIDGIQQITEAMDYALSSPRICTCSFKKFVECSPDLELLLFGSVAEYDPSSEPIHTPYGYVYVPGNWMPRFRGDPLACLHEVYEEYRSQ